MFTYTTQMLRTVRQLRLPSAALNTQAASKADGQWNIYCGVCLERKPVISRPIREIEAKVSNLLRTIEDERSMLCGHELRLIGDEKHKENVKKGKVSKEDLDKAIGTTALEFEDLSRKELDAFTFPSPITEADKSNNFKSTDRALDRHLVYVVKKKPSINEIWTLPEGELLENESLLEAAKRIIRENFGSTVKAKFYGNAPCGYIKYKYPKPINKKNGFVGMHLFYMKAQFFGGNVESRDEVLDYIWATRDQLKERINDYKKINEFLMDEEH